MVTITLITSGSLMASDYITIGKEFSLFTSKNLEGYLKPLFTTIEQSINSNYYTIAMYDTCWTFAVDISTMGMLIPDDQQTYIAQRPDKFGDSLICQTAEYRNGVLKRNYTGPNIQPTIYGGRSTPIFSQPQIIDRYPDSTYKTVAYVEGNNLNYIAGIPNLQLIFGFPTRTQLRTKFFFVPVQKSTLSYFAFNVNQQLDHFFHLFNDEDKMAIAVNFAYQNMTRNKGLSLNSIAFGAHFSKEWVEGLTTYAGLQYENLFGKFTAVRDTTGIEGVIDSPYPEVRNSQDLVVNFDTFTNFRALGGVSYRYGIAEVHFDGAWASQPQIDFGITIWIASIGKADTGEKKIERKEKDKPIKRKNKREKSD